MELCPNSLCRLQNSIINKLQVAYEPRRTQNIARCCVSHRRASDELDIRAFLAHRTVQSFLKDWIKIFGFQNLPRSKKTSVCIGSLGYDGSVVILKIGPLDIAVHKQKIFDNVETYSIIHNSIHYLFIQFILDRSVRERRIMPKGRVE